MNAEELKKYFSNNPYEFENIKEQYKKDNTEKLDEIRKDIINNFNTLSKKELEKRITQYHDSGYNHLLNTILEIYNKRFN